MSCKVMRKLYTGADPEGVVWGGGYIQVGGTVILGLFLVFVKPNLLEV